MTNFILRFIITAMNTAILTALASFIGKTYLLPFAVIVFFLVFFALGLDFDED
ncbi:MAG: hypothetical protein NNA22_11300 [Nitrospira sp.]|nr:hypothetical protein [Nitrospira sp.]